MGGGGVATLAKPVVPPPKLVLPPRNQSEAFIRGGLNSATPTPMKALLSSFLTEQDPYGMPLSPLFTDSLSSPYLASMDGGEPGFFNNFVNRGKALDGVGCDNFMEKLEGNMQDGVERAPSQPTCARYKAYMPSKLPIPYNFTQFTIPPGLSPASLLESPVLFSMGQGDPSPTTGRSILLAPLQRREQIDTGLDECSDGSPKRSDSFNFRPFPLVAKSEPSISSDMDAPPVHCELETSVLQNELGHEATSWLTSHVSLGGPEHQSHAESMTMTSTDAPPDHVSARFSTDGYKWKKYGQKQLKNSENPRSYYKCTYPNCPVKKQVERSQEGEITEIMYKGDHNHPKPQNTRRGSRIGGVSTLEKAISGASYDCVNLDKTSCDLPQSFVRAYGGLPATPELSFNSPSNGGEEGDQASMIMKDEDDGEEFDSKRRRIENEDDALPNGPIRTVREPRVVVQTVSQVDILDDGYRWRKYGQKVVKGHLHPRNYYKCTNVGCSVRKHVERSSTDSKSVITTYEGKHNHSVPPARGSGREHNRM